MLPVGAGWSQLVGTWLLFTIMPLSCFKTKNAEKYRVSQPAVSFVFHSDLMNSLHLHYRENAFEVFKEML